MVAPEKLKSSPRDHQKDCTEYNMYGGMTTTLQNLILLLLLLIKSRGQFTVVLMWALRRRRNTLKSVGLVGLTLSTCRRHSL